MGALAVALAVVGTSPAASAAEDPAAPLYRPGIVNVIKLELPPSSIEALEAEPEEYQPGTFSLAETDGTPGGIGEYSTPIDAQIRLKGSGTFKPLGKKSAFKIKLGKKAPFRGLRKMTLNNMVQDSSMVHEAMAYRVFHALGVPASRTSYAEVWVNGVNYGLHANVETLDKVALEKRFGEFQDPPQHLYEAEFYISDDATEELPSDVTESGIGLFQVDEGDEGDRSDLETLLDAHTNPGADWSDAVAPYTNLVEMTRNWIGEKYVGQFDGYVGWPEGFISDPRPNNYYLYSDPAGRFRMFPWGLDWTFTEKVAFGAFGGSLLEHCLGDIGCLGLYKAAGERALETLPQLDLDTMARCLALRLQPWQEREPPALESPTAQQIAKAVVWTREFVAAQPQRLAEYLGVPVPEQPHSGECAPYGSEEPESLEEPPLGEEEGGGGEEPGQGQSAAATDTSVPVSPVEGEQVLLRIGPLSLDRNHLFVQVQAPVPGTLRLRVSGGGVKTICGTRLQVRAGSTAVVCRLASSDREMLSHRRRWLTITASLRTDGGVRFTAERTFRSRRPSRA